MKRLGTQDLGGGRLTGLPTPQGASDAIPRSYIRYDWPTSCLGQPNTGEIMPYLVVPVALVLPANLTGSLARALTAPSANTTWTLYQIPSGSTTATAIATLAFSSGSTVGVFTMNSATNVGVNDILYWKAASSADSAFSDVAILVAALRQ